MRRLFAASVLILSVLMFPVWPQTDLPVGQILGRVSCQQDISQSYALYLPSTYDPDSRWPVVFCFDPAAQGVEAVHFYREAAEKYGYVVLGSNNSRNGPLSRIFDAADAMITDARGRLTIDEDRVYFSGFSGGARVAARLGMPGNLTLSKVHEAAENIKRDLLAKIPNLDRVTVHMEPLGTSEIYSDNKPPAEENQTYN